MKLSNPTYYPLMQSSKSGSQLPQVRLASPLQPVLNKNMSFDEQKKVFIQKLNKFLDSKPDVKNSSLLKSNIVFLYLQVIDGLKNNPDVAFKTMNNDNFIRHSLPEMQKNAENYSKAVTSAVGANTANIGTAIFFAPALVLTIPATIASVANVFGKTDENIRYVDKLKNEALKKTPNFYDIEKDKRD